MTRVPAAIGITVGATLLALIMGIALNLRFGFPIFSMFLLMAAPFCLAFGLWLYGHGYCAYAKYAMGASAVLILGVATPLVAPGVVAYFKSIGTWVNQRAASSALERLAPKPVAPRQTLVGANGETIYWWHPCDPNPIFYDRGGEHPRGCGALQRVTPDVALLLDRLRQQTRVEQPAQTAPAAAPTPLAMPPAPVATPTPAPEAVWLELPRQNVPN